MILDYYKFLRAINKAFYKAYRETQDNYYYVVSVLRDSTLIVESSSEELFKVAFVEDGDLFTFSDISEWVKVDMVYVEKEQRDFFALFSDAKQSRGGNVGTAGGGVRLQYRNSSIKVSEDDRSYSGYGIVFDSDSVAMTINDRSAGTIDVVEQITRQSIEGADMTDVIAAINHDFAKILGRTSSGTLELSIDDNGVMYRFDVPETTYGNDLLISTRRGDYKGSSFTFSIDPNEGYLIEERSDGSLLAIPKKVKKVYEMGPVTNPAYEATTAENRSNALFSAASEFLKNREDQQGKQEPNSISEDKMKEIEQKIRLSEEEMTI